MTDFFPSIDLMADGGESFEEWRGRTINLFLECFGSFFKKICLKLFFLEATESLSSRADHGVDGCDTEDRVFSRIVEITCVVPKQGFLNQVVALSF